MKNNINLIDVTLRDGGFTCDFDWPLEFAKEYYNLMCDLDVKFIELGYWQQTQKSKNKFYNLDQEMVEKVTGSRGKRNVSIMIDYHYCSKNLDLYPTKLQNEISLIRLTARKDLIDDAILFAKKLKDTTGLAISFNIFNITNYTLLELQNTVDKILKSDFEFVYMADTHGHLDLNADIKYYENFFKKIKDLGIKTGFHLHDHTGKSFLNYTKCLESSYIDFCDTSIMSLGKGAGNLRLESVLKKDEMLRTSKFVYKYYNDFFKKTINPFYMVTGAYSITDNYANQALERGLSIDDFIEFCSNIEHVDRDNFNKRLLEEYSR